MKNLKMFAVAVMAFAVMAMGVRATSNPTPDYPNAKCDPDTKNCAVKIGEHYYTTLALAIMDVKDGDTIDLLTNVDGTSANNLGTFSGYSLFTSTKGISTKLTINVGEYKLDLGTNAMYLKDGGSLTLKGTGEVAFNGSSNNYLVTVPEGATFTTEGNLLITLSSAKAVATAAGKVVIGEGAELTAGTESIVTVTARTADVTLNATVGESVAVSVPVVLVQSSANPTRNQAGAKVTFEGGEYNTTAAVMTVENGAVVKVTAGKYTSNSHVFPVASGSLTITGGTFESATGAVIRMNGKSDIVIDGENAKLTSKGNTTVFTDAAAEGTLTIKRGTITSKTSNALYFNGGKVTYKIEGAEYISAKNYPAIYIDDNLLTGMNEGGNEDNFKGIITGGKFLYMIVGEAKNAGKVSGKNYSATEVARYLIAEGLEEKTEGDYKLVGNGAGNTPAEPEPSNPSDIPPVPQTNDNILVYAGLGLVSLASVAFTTRKRED